MFEIGSNVGMAFQIKDDILDFANGNNTGKKAGNDIKEKKLNLPLLIYLNSESNFSKSKDLLKIKYFNKKGKFTSQLINNVRNSGALEKAENYMNSYLDKALSEIEAFEDSIDKSALKSLILYTTTRNK
jgi:octaprenyl-diphosphate synthase